ncbi:hypothetical protein MYSI104531_20320 [Mycobacterium simiae]
MAKPNWKVHAGHTIGACSSTSDRFRRAHTVAATIPSKSNTTTSWWTARKFPTAKAAHAASELAAPTMLGLSLKNNAELYG